MDNFDELFFKDIFNKNYDRIYTAFLRKTQCESVADDLTQQTFIKTWQYRSSFDFSLSTELQLNRKAKLVFIDWLRKEAHQRKLKSAIEFSYSSKDYSLSKFELTDTIEAALKKLPPMRKKVFQLAYIQGFSRKEIAQTLNISPKTVDAHIAKALPQMRKAIALSMVMSAIMVNTF